MKPSRRIAHRRSRRARRRRRRRRSSRRLARLGLRPAPGGHQRRRGPARRHARSALQDAFKAALKDQVEAAVKAGTLTRAQADAIEARIAAGQGLGFGGPRWPGRPGGPGGMHRGGSATRLGARPPTSG